MAGPLSSFPDNLKALRQDPFLREMHRLSEGSSSTVYLVGGVIRNMVLGAPVGRDYDFAVITSKLENFCSLAAERLGGRCFLLDKETMTFRVAIKKDGSIITLDFAPLRGGDIKEDLLDRDFTVNALAMDIKELFGKHEPVVADITGGLADCRKRVLRAVRDHVFDSDPLRMLRAVRLSQEYGLSIARHTASLIKERSALLKGAAPERIRDELLIIFTVDGTVESINRLFEFGLSRVVLPELGGWRDIGGYDLLTHSLATLWEAEALVREIEGTKKFGDSTSRLSEHLESAIGVVKRRALFKLAALLHDAGKPVTIKREDGVLRFIGHDREGARLVKSILTRLRFSRRVAVEVANLVRNHHRTFTLASLERPTVRTKAHFFRAVGGEPALSLLLLALADARATRGAEDEELLELVMELIGFYFNQYIIVKQKPLMDGHEIMETFKVPEGKIVGEIMEKISEGLEEGVIKTKDDAVSFIRRWLKEKGSVN